MNDSKICKDCKTEFTVTEGEALYFGQRGLELPKRCKQCRAARRAERERDEQR